MKLILNLVEMNEIDFEFIFYHSGLIWLNLNAIYFMVTYSDFVIFNFYEHYTSVWIEMKNENYFIIQLIFTIIHGSYYPFRYYS